MQEHGTLKIGSGTSRNNLAAEKVQKMLYEARTGMREKLFCCGITTSELIRELIRGAGSGRRELAVAALSAAPRDARMTELCCALLGALACARGGRGAAPGAPVCRALAASLRAFPASAAVASAAVTVVRTAVVSAAAGSDAAARPRPASAAHARASYETAYNLVCTSKVLRETLESSYQ